MWVMKPLTSFGQMDSTQAESGQQTPEACDMLIASAMIL